MYVKDTIAAIPINALNAGLLLPAFQPLNPLGLDFPCFLIKIVNDSNVAVSISYDGNVQHDYIAEAETFTFYGQPNNEPNNKVSLFQKGLIIYVAAPAPGMGVITLSGYYHPKGA